MAVQDTHIVQLDSLTLGEHSFDFQLDNSYFITVEKSELLGGNVCVKANLILHETNFDLEMNVQGTVQVACDRCLDPMDISVNACENEWEWDEDVHSIDLAWLAYELIVVNLPLVHSHQPGGCNPQMAALLQDHLCATVDE